MLEYRSVGLEVLDYRGVGIQMLHDLHYLTSDTAHNGKTSHKAHNVTSATSIYADTAHNGKTLDKAHNVTTICEF